MTSSHPEPLSLDGTWDFIPDPLARFAQGAGHIVVTTLRLAPEVGPVATAMLESLVQRAGSIRLRRFT